MNDELLDAMLKMAVMRDGLVVRLFAVIAVTMLSAWAVAGIPEYFGGKWIRAVHITVCLFTWAALLALLGVIR